MKKLFMTLITLTITLFVAGCGTMTNDVFGPVATVTPPVIDTTKVDDPHVCNDLKLEVHFIDGRMERNFIDMLSYTQEMYGEIQSNMEVSEDLETMTLFRRYCPSYQSERRVVYEYNPLLKSATRNHEHCIELGKRLDEEVQKLDKYFIGKSLSQRQAWERRLNFWSANSSLPQLRTLASEYSFRRSCPEYWRERYDARVYN